MATAYPVATVSAALEREEALLGHLNDNRDYYRGRIFAALPSQTQRDMLRSRGYDLPGIELRALGRDGSTLAFPLVGPVPPNVQAYFDRIITSNTRLDAEWTTEVELPTLGIHLQTRCQTATRVNLTSSTFGAPRSRNDAQKRTLPRRKPIRYGSKPNGSRNGWTRPRHCSTTQRPRSSPSSE